MMAARWIAQVLAGVARSLVPWVWAALFATPAFAAEWRELKPGRSRDEVVALLGEPSRRFVATQTETLTWRGSKAPVGTSELQVVADRGTSRVTHVKVTPQAGAVSVADLQRDYGPRCASAPATQPCSNQWKNPAGQLVLYYPALGLTVLLTPEGKAATSLTFAEIAASTGDKPPEGPAAVAASQDTPPNLTQPQPPRDAPPGDAPSQAPGEGTAPVPQELVASAQQPAGSQPSEQSAPMEPPPAESPAMAPPASEATPSEPPAADSGSSSGSFDDGWGDISGFSPIPESTASTSTEVTPATAAPVERDLEFSGRLRAQSFYVPHDFEEEKVSGRQSVELALKSEVKFGAGQASGTLLARRDFVDDSRDRFDVEELFVTLKGSRWRLSAGRMLMTWGTASLFNPTDVLNPVDQRDALRTEKHGTWMARAGLVFDSFLAEVYYLPVPEAHILPPITGVAADGTLLSPSPWVVGSIGQEGPLPINYHLRPSRVPRPSSRNAQAAGRLAFSLLGTDLSVGYAFLFDRLPTLSADFALQDPPTAADLTISTSYRRQHVFTFDVERTFGGVRLAGEAAFFRTQRAHPDEPKDQFISYVVGGDYQTPQFLDDHHVRLFLEFSDTRGVQAPLQEDFIRRLRYPLKRALLGRVEYQVGSDWVASVTAASSLARYDLLLLSEVEFSLSDSLKARLSGAVMRGEAGSFYGPYRDNSRLEGVLEASF